MKNDFTNKAFGKMHELFYSAESATEYGYKVVKLESGQTIHYTHALPKDSKANTKILLPDDAVLKGAASAPFNIVKFKLGAVEEKRMAILKAKTFSEAPKLASVT